MLEYIEELTNEALMNNQVLAKKCREGSLKAEDLRLVNPDNFDLSLKNIVRNKEIFLLGSLKRQVYVLGEELEQKEGIINELRNCKRVFYYKQMEAELAKKTSETESLKRKVTKMREILLESRSKKERKHVQKRLERGKRDQRKAKTRRKREY